MFYSLVLLFQFDVSYAVHSSHSVRSVNSVDGGEAFTEQLGEDLIAGEGEVLDADTVDNEMGDNEIKDSEITVDGRR